MIWAGLGEKQREEDRKGLENTSVMWLEYSSDLSRPPGRFV